MIELFNEDEGILEVYVSKIGILPHLHAVAFRI